MPEQSIAARTATTWTEALRRFNTLLDHSGDTESFAARLNEYLCETFGADASSLILIDPRSDELVFHTGSGIPSTKLNQARLTRSEGIVGWVCAHERAVNVPDARADERFCSRVDRITGFFTRCVIGAPLFGGGALIGALEVINRTDGEPFTDEQLELLEVVAEPIGRLVANHRLVSGLQRRNSELTTLIAIDRAVNAIHDLSELLGTILSSAAQVAQAAGSSVVLRDLETDELTFFSAVGPAQAQLAGVKIEAGKGVVGHCIDSGESIYVADAYQDERFFQDVDMQTGFRTTSLLAVPLKTAMGVIGALEVVNLPQLDDPTDLLSLVEAFASQAAVAIERAQLNQRLARRVDTANEQLRRANLTLANEKAKLTAMIEQMADGVIMIDADGRLLMVNSAARLMFALGDDPLEGQPALAARNVGLGAVLAVDDAGPAGFELALEQPEPRILRVHAATVKGEGPIGRVVVFSDITELKELASLRTELVSFVSHELRTPLTSIKGFVQVLLNDARLKGEDHQSFIKIIDHECDRLRRMVADLLCMTRIDSGRALDVVWQQIDLAVLIEHVIEAQRIYAPGHTLRLELEQRPLVVEADQDKIEQILTNLVNNAIKYSSADSAVVIRVEAHDGQVTVSVIDEGFGIAPEDLPHLFQQYSRLPDAEHRRIRGTGLGLYLTKHLVEAHGGHMDVTSVVGQGSTFSFTWPRRRRWEDF